MISHCPTVYFNFSSQCVMDVLLIILVLFVKKNKMRIKISYTNIIYQRLPAVPLAYVLSKTLHQYGHISEILFPIFITVTIKNLSFIQTSDPFFTSFRVHFQKFFLSVFQLPMRQPSAKFLVTYHVNFLKFQIYSVGELYFAFICILL